MAKEICRRDGAYQISTLPDDMLVRILSLVPTEEAVITSLLSKRWKFLWTLIPVLDFDYARFSIKFNAPTLIDQKRRFLEFVEHVLFRHELQPLEKLRLAFEIAEFEEYISKASMLVKFAMRSNCLTIDLEFCSQRTDTIILFPKYDKMYTLPPCFFPHQSVSQMKLTNCKFTPSLYRNFTSVNIAKLTSVALPKDSVYDLVSQCPCLEELHLIECKIYSRFFELNAPKSNLKCLVFQSCVGNKWFSPLKHASIHIPTLLKLKYKGSFSSGYLSLHNSENIIEAEIDIYSRPPRNKLCELLMSLQNVKSLTLFSVKLKVLNTNGGINLLAPLNNLKHLTVNLGQADKELMGLMCLLRSSPHLETLSIDFGPNFDTEDELLSAVYNVDEEVVRQLRLLSSESVAHLMKIKINNFLGIKVEMEFVEHILRSSLCLKEMVICIISRYYYLDSNADIISKENYKALKKKTIASLLACTRASADAKILLEYGEYVMLKVPTITIV